jgi:hypothetical protein
MVALLATLAIGLLLGIRHASDPDHIIAVSTIVSREHSVTRALGIGVAWGIGHTLTILVVGSAMILFRIELPSRVGLGMEFGVAVMLIALGIRNLLPLLNWSVQKAGIRSSGETAEYHAHGDYVHAHPQAQEAQHPHDPKCNPLSMMDRIFRFSRAYGNFRSFVVGVVHGLAGSAAIALLVLGTIADLRLAILYLVAFGLGTIVGMMFITLTIASTITLGERRFASLGRHLCWASGAISLVFGLFVTYQIAIVDGLFRPQVHWIAQ